MLMKSRLKEYEESLKDFIGMGRMRKLRSSG